jgi:5-methylcytosine-specific restriction protein B
MTIWKLGCNWDKGNPSFYGLIFSEKIVLGHIHFPYKIGDLIIITSGFTVLAIALIKALPQAVTENLKLKPDLIALKVPYESDVTYAIAEWYELEKADRFTYKLVQGIRQVRNHDIKKKTLSLWDKFIMAKSNKSKTSIGEISLNTILYGPPGTGKTYNVVKMAAEIVSNTPVLDYRAAKEVYDEKLHDQIEFISFHQNYSYEEFIQGIRPDIEGSEGLIKFVKKDGIFKKIADKAFSNWRLSNEKHLNPSFEQVFEEFFKPVIDESGTIKIQMESKDYSFEITRYNERERNFNFTKQSGGKSHRLYVPTIKAFFEHPELEPTQGLKYYYRPLANALRAAALTMVTKGSKNNLKKFVLIIDEINRANISRVFGELITVVEEDKRWGNAHEMEVMLPSEDKLVIPNNLYILGTMNTADKSISLMDIALRRRFNFIGVFPTYDEQIIPVWASDILRRLNEKIYKFKKSPDFFIGHAFFINKPYTELNSVFDQKIIPLLIEYFQNNITTVTEILDAVGLTYDPPTIENNYQIKLH